MTAPMNSPAGPEFAPSVSANQVTGRPGSTPESESISEEVRRRRLGLGITQVQLADQAGVSLDSIQAIEAGRRPTMRAKTVFRITGALDRIENPPPPAPCECGAGVDELAGELADERAAHQQTLATLRAIRALLDSHGGLQ